MPKRSQKQSTARVYVKSSPNEPLEIGPTEYRNKIINSAKEIVSGIESNIQPSGSGSKNNTESRPQTQKYTKIGHGLKEKELQTGYTIRRTAQELVSNIKDTITPTAKPWNPEEITGFREYDSSRRSGKQLYVKLSDRMELLARPKKGVLYQEGFECPLGAIPEKHLPSWRLLPLHNKIPADRYPYEINMAQVPEELFTAPSVNKTMNLDDLSNPDSEYNSLLDPGLQTYFNKPAVRENLIKSGLMTKNGRIVCTLKELNDYRRHLARKQARAVQMTLKAEYEEEKRVKEEKKKEEAAKREEEREKRKTLAELKKQVKETVKEAEEKTAEEIFTLEEAKRGEEIVEKLDKKREEEKLKKRRKLVEFWDRKAQCQSDWLEKGFELERKWLQERDENIKARQARISDSPSTVYDEETDSFITPTNKTPASSRKEKTLDIVLRKKFQTTQSHESLRGNPSREEILSPVSSEEITLEDILKK
ncbi:hypothetical protein JTE90_025330 [Oedothorax gibbosus]|uniref:Uncharacterized protein n=1 Tax=Oedothorax gibbosus TaxID=931172 RepID=A0AAV6V750_9ARAC|nr:hypothetical protein JTE90_025330 [Oedothorax gibbosus]